MITSINFRITIPDEKTKPKQSIYQININQLR